MSNDTSHRRPSDPDSMASSDENVASSNLSAGSTITAPTSTASEKGDLMSPSDGASEAKTSSPFIPSEIEAAKEEAAAAAAADEDGEDTGDQTTWRRFKEGGVIEPPESDLHPLPISLDKTTSSFRQTTFSSSRFFPSKGGEVDKSERSSRCRVKGSGVVVALVPLGDDGRTFTFVTPSSSSKRL
ncbi:hypothetical protein CBS101457_004582 [Exobasidium rhododendri]|nr:hypothetical protein CBS101457_004582 [Exobasidium rhododendri]